MRGLVPLVLLLGAGCRSLPFDAVTLGEGDRGGPRILCVTAHPDDEIAFAGALYKSATLLKGAWDLVVLTNGEGGFKYATLAEPIYGLELTDEAIGRANLPRIRRRELVAGCRILGAHRIFFLGQSDHRYTRDASEVLAEEAGVWDLPFVRRSLDAILASGHYDFLFTLAPVPQTHGHHKAAAILALEALRRMPSAERPIALCARTSGADEPAGEPPGLADYPITAVRSGDSFVFDRRQAFGHRHRLDYRIVVDWAIAEHKSQGTMQLLAHRGDLERYFLFALDPPGAAERVRALFTALERPQFRPRSYGPSAGTNAASRPGDPD